MSYLERLPWYIYPRLEITTNHKMLLENYEFWAKHSVMSIFSVKKCPFVALHSLPFFTTRCSPNQRDILCVRLAGVLLPHVSRDCHYRRSPWVGLSSSLPQLRRADVIPNARIQLGRPSAQRKHAGTSRASTSSSPILSESKLERSAL